MILLYLDDIFRFLCCFYKLFGNEAMFLFNDSKKNDIMWNVIKYVIFVKSHLTTFSKIKLYYLFVKRTNRNLIFIRCLLQIVQQIKWLQGQARAMINHIFCQQVKTPPMQLLLLEADFPLYSLHQLLHHQRKIDKGIRLKKG